MKVKLNQILAIEKGVKSSVNRKITDLHKADQKSAMFTGISRTYSPKDEDGDRLPSESTLVQRRSHDVLRELAEASTELWDVVATKDRGNMTATADVIVDGLVVVPQAPVTFLLFLEKQLQDVRTFVDNLQVLDPSEEWVFDANVNCFATKPTETVRTKKIPRNHVLSEATDKHPAQVQVFNEDVVVGTWRTTKFSGALPQAAKTEYLKKVEKLQRAVKFAREQANSTEVERINNSKLIFDYLLD